MINFYFADLAKFVMAFLLALLGTAHNAVAHTSMVGVGDHLAGMTLTKGAADARPLWAFCATEVKQNVTTANCRVPQVDRLAIGHVFLGTEEAFHDADWSALHWELYLDDQLIDLKDFGTYDYVLPAMAPNPSLVREVLMRFTAWDVVLTNLQPGAHTIYGHVRANAEEYSWNVDLMIEGESAEISSSGYIRSSSYRCPQSLEGRSLHQHSCRIYGLASKTGY